MAPDLAQERQELLRLRRGMGIDRRGELPRGREEADGKREPA
jgi:hypothetical protein